MPSDQMMQKMAELATDQWGLLTRQQAEAAGVAPTTFTRLVGGFLERVAHGVYRVAAAPAPDHLELRAAYLQLEPELTIWERTGEHGVVSHRSAASIYGLGHLPADIYEFTLPKRRQVRRKDVRIHVAALEEKPWIAMRGLLVTRPSRIAADLLRTNEDPEAVAQITVEALRNTQDYPRSFVGELAPLAFRLGFRKGAGHSVLRWLLELSGDDDVRTQAFEMLAKGA